uniref:Uncharacterized protein n=1 Tax=viral metagenome TaxID=1070528 RepID=A0A6C0AEL4_9ZZZZ
MLIKINNKFLNSYFHLILDTNIYGNPENFVASRLKNMDGFFCFYILSGSGDVVQMNNDKLDICDVGIECEFIYKDNKLITRIDANKSYDIFANLLVVYEDSTNLKLIPYQKRKNVGTTPFQINR